MTNTTSVRGVCPACGTSLLFVGNGGYITCSLHNCPDPGAADHLLFNSREIVHGLKQAARAERTLRGADSQVVER